MKKSNFNKAGSVLLPWLLAGLISCNPGREAVEDNATLDNIEKEEVDASGGAVVPDNPTIADTMDAGKLYTIFTNTAHFEGWDLDDDGFLSEEEFTSSFYQSWDTDNDNRISQNEWTKAMKDFRVDPADWTAWDTDGDGYLEMAEFETDFSMIGWYDAWDSDNDRQVTDREYTTGVYSLMDTNGDNILDETEYNRYSLYYGN
ncbi:EF-hand domain-containing protein [Pontibacter locisalis]|uniref:EF-hand domain-containing protein n=1 Tax=Pontibacter locisalis TaxID=1719035 RepID=A0ABW5IQV7_9BACT